MKSNFTFEEVSKILATVVKVDSFAKKQMEATKAYDEKDEIFDAEFAKYGYTFFGAPEELHIMFNEKCALMDVMEKAERKAYKVIKEFMALIMDANRCDWYEEDVIYYIKHKYYFNVEKIAERCKSLAVMAAGKIRY